MVDSDWRQVLPPGWSGRPVDGGIALQSPDGAEVRFGLPDPTPAGVRRQVLWAVSADWAKLTLPTDGWELEDVAAGGYVIHRDDERRFVVLAFGDDSAAAERIACEQAPRLNATPYVLDVEFIVSARAALRGQRLVACL